jgi:putative PIN family toxin of toxin-antitoxin system
MSALFFDGLPLKLVRLIFGESCKAVVSPDIVLEYNETFQKMLLKLPNPIYHFSLELFIKQTKQIKPVSDIHICRDPDDDKFLASAVDSHCNYIVSGDTDLLVLKEFQGIPIITTRQFLDILSSLP